MLLSKIKVVWAVALAVVVGAGAIGLAYKAVAADPQRSPQANHQPAAKGAANSAPAARGSDRGAVDEMEALRLEIEALRKGLQATRARVKALENEVRTLRGKKGAFNPYQQSPNVPHDHESAYPKPRGPKPAYTDLNGGPKPNYPDSSKSDPIADAEAALKKLRKHPNDKEAADALERALRRLKNRRNAPASRNGPER